MKQPSDVRLLIVDDEKDLREIIAKTFRIFGFQVEEAENGEVAWRMIQDGGFDIVFTDIKMPVLDGLGLLEKMKNSKTEMPKVLVTSGYTDTSLEMIYDLGALGFLAKPVGAAAVREAIARGLLRRADLWATPYRPGSVAKIQRRFSSVESAVRTREILFGEGGFCLSFKSQPPPVGTDIEFSLTIGDLNPVRAIEGLGAVRWSREIKDDRRVHVVGIEIRSLSQDCRSKYCDWLVQQKFRIFIPAAT
jgi:CheY-like chemotaxis protein